MTYAAELHCHSSYSFCDGASLPQELAQRAAEYGYETLALTDHDNVCGAMELAQACKDLPLRPIHGAELSVRDAAGDFHLTVLVESADAWHNLCRLLSSHAKQMADRCEDGGVAGQQGRQIHLQELVGFTEGLIAVGNDPPYRTGHRVSSRSLCYRVDVNGPDSLLKIGEIPGALADYPTTRLADFGSGKIKHAID